MLERREREDFICKHVMCNLTTARRPMACTNKTVVILWLNQFHLTGCSDHLRGRGIFINRLCLTDLPSMGKNCWFIFIHPFWECVCKWVGLGYILAFLLSKAHCLAFGPIWSKLCPSLDSFCRGTPNNSFCSNVLPNHSNSGPALSSNPVLSFIEYLYIPKAC